MKALLRFECIGDGAPISRTLHRLGIRVPLPPRYYVYRLTMANGELHQHRLEHMKDFTEANGAGTRGVYAEYILSEGEYYEVKQPRTWDKADYYYCTARAGDVVRITKEEVMACLENARSG